MEVPWDNNLYKHEKGNRFEAVYDDGYCVFDNETNYCYHTESQEVAMQLAELLNKQQALINALKKENKELKKGVDVPLPYVENSMRRLRAEHKVDEQQATINNQEQKIKILQQEINDTQAILEMLTEKLKGWNDE